MHAKSGLRVVLKWEIFRPDSVIAAVIPPQETVLPRQICVLCGLRKSTRTGDHLPPQCIYPPPRKPNLELHKVPACEICNNAGAKHDEEFKVVLSFLTGEYRDNPEAIISSLGKTIGSNNRLANQVFSTQQRGYADRGSGILEPVTKLTFREESYNSVIQRIVRGMYWRETAKIMKQDATVTVWPARLLDRSAAENLRDLLFLSPPKLFNDDTFAYRVFFNDDGYSIWGLQFFGKHIVFAGATTDSNADNPAEPNAPVG